MVVYTYEMASTSGQKCAASRLYNFCTDDAYTQCPVDIAAIYIHDRPIYLSLKSKKERQKKIVALFPLCVNILLYLYSF